MGNLSVYNILYGRVATDYNKLHCSLTSWCIYQFMIFYMDVPTRITTNPIFLYILVNLLICSILYTCVATYYKISLHLSYNSG